MSEKKKHNQHDDFFKNYRGRYSRFWIERWGIIPELPTSFDNANSIYELIAWLQRAFKNLLDDFQQLESELEDFKNALIELLELIVPELIRRYHASQEFRDLFIKMLKDILEGEGREWFKQLLREILREPDMISYLKELLKDLLNDPQIQEFIKNYLETLLNDPTFLSDLKRLLGITNLEQRVEDLEDELQQLTTKYNTLETALMKIISNLQTSGAWTGGLAGGLNQGRNIATGNINLFGGTADGSSFIRTNNGQTENDLAGGV